MLSQKKQARSSYQNEARLFTKKSIPLKALYLLINIEKYD